MLNKYWPFLPTAVLLLAFILIGSCSSTTNVTTKATMPTTSSSGISFSQDIQNIFNLNCVVCHQGTNAPEGLSLEAGVSYQNIVNKDSAQSFLMLVSIGNNEESYLWHKLNGTHRDIGGSGLQMPYNLPPLTQDKLDLVKKWINEGALNN